MPLEATHIRFALDLKEKYQVQDIKKYIVGAIYPDSRFVTKIDRVLTHSDEVLRPEFAIDDFNKGWQSHLICDSMHIKMKKLVMPEVFIKDEGVYDEEEWIISTSMKIIQDMNDMQQFPIQEYLKYLEFAYNPNGENIGDVKKYNQIMIDHYRNKTRTNVEDNYRLLLALGVEADLGLKIKYKTEELLKDELVVKRIENVYNDMINNYPKFI